MRQMKGFFISAVIWKNWMESLSMYPTDNQCPIPLSGCYGWWVPIADFEGWHFLHCHVQGADLLCSWARHTLRLGKLWFQQGQIWFAVELVSRESGPTDTTVSCHSPFLSQRTTSFYYQLATKLETHAIEQNKSEPINVCIICCSLRIA